MADQTYQLVVRKGPRPGQVFPLTLDTITIGRDPLSDIVLNDPEISRHHAKMMRRGDSYELQDMGSTNGSFVDGKRMGGDAILLKPGQVVMLGSNVTLIFQATSASDPLATMIAPTGLPQMETPQPEMPAPEPEPVMAEPIEVEMPEPMMAEPMEPEPMMAEPMEPEMPEPMEEAPTPPPMMREEEEEEVGMATVMEATPPPSYTPEPEPPRPSYSFEEPKPPPPSYSYEEPKPMPSFDEPEPMPAFDSGQPLPDFGARPAGSPPPPPPPPAGTPGKSGMNRNLIIGIIVVLVLCCCCLVAVAVAYQQGLFDQLSIPTTEWQRVLAGAVDRLALSAKAQNCPF